MKSITVAAPASAGHGNEFLLHLGPIVRMETEFHGSDALRVRSSAEDLALVVLQRLDPVCDVARVMRNVGRDAEFVCHEGRCQLTAEAEALFAIEELSEDRQARLDAVNERIHELDDREEVWSPETLRIAGAIVSVGYDGSPEIHRGFVKPEDMPEETSDDSAEDGASVPAERDASALSSALIESLTAHRSAALSAALLDHPEVALALLVERLAHPVFYNGPYGDGVLQITPRVASFHRVEGSTAFAAIEAAREHWRSRLPAESEALLAWCFMQSIASLQGLLTFCVAQTVNAVLQKGERSTSPRMEQAKTIAGLLNLDMAAWFTPTAGNYFGRASKATIIGNLEEIKGAVAPAWYAMKKTELASLAEREAVKARWIPPMLRAQPPLPAPESVAVH